MLSVVSAIQEAGEAYLVGLFEDTHLTKRESGIKKNVFEFWKNWNMSSTTVVGWVLDD